MTKTSAREQYLAEQCVRARAALERMAGTSYANLSLEEAIGRFEMAFWRARRVSLAATDPPQLVLPAFATHDDECTCAVCAPWTVADG